MPEPRGGRMFRNEARPARRLLLAFHKRYPRRAMLEPQQTTVRIMLEHFVDGAMGSPHELLVIKAAGIADRESQGRPGPG